MKEIVDENAYMISWVGPGKRIIVYPIDFDNQYNVVCTHPQELSDRRESKEDSEDGKLSPPTYSCARSCIMPIILGQPLIHSLGYNQKASLATVQAIYSDFEPRARRLFELTDPEGFRVWKLVDMEDIPSWSSNCTTLLGDAAHPVEPFGFSGASMAIEDGLTLTALFGKDLKVGDTQKIKDRLRLYQHI